MMRKATSTSMQKTYDECYLICSTAVYFEGQNNEAEALRSWRTALDQIYYHNAYRVPPNYVAKNETERALQDSLRSMEMQCKERVDLLEALRKSRRDLEKKKSKDKMAAPSQTQTYPIDPSKSRYTSRSGNGSRHTSASDISLPSTETTAATATSTSASRTQFTAMGQQGWLSEGSVQPISLQDLPTRLPPPKLPPRSRAIEESLQYPDPSSSIRQISSHTHGRSSDKPPSPKMTIPSSTVPPSSATPLAASPAPTTRSRTPSPEKRSGRVMLTTLRGSKDGKSKPSKANKFSSVKPPASSSKAAGLAWDAITRAPGSRSSSSLANGQAAKSDTLRRDSINPDILSTTIHPQSSQPIPHQNSNPSALGGNALVQSRSPASQPYKTSTLSNGDNVLPSGYASRSARYNSGNLNSSSEKRVDPHTMSLEPPIPPPHKQHHDSPADTSTPTASVPKTRQESLTASHTEKSLVNYPSYRTEFPPVAPSTRATAEFKARLATRDVSARQQSKNEVQPSQSASRSARRPVAGSSSSNANVIPQASSVHESKVEDDKRASRPKPPKPRKTKPADKVSATPVDSDQDSNSHEDAKGGETLEGAGENDRIAYIQKHLPKGVDEQAAKQIFNEIVVKGDEVHWADVAGLDTAKTALKEAVVYPFLRPDLFLGLREPARGMLLFGPPGTGKTMLARAVATESKSTFFAISASSLTSKWLGESEKLVRALFLLSKALAPSIIFVDEIDSLLSARGGSSEHESTRRIKTEFLIQWSDLQRAAAGKQQSEKEQAEGDASRVLVLAATNTPWAIDEAARRRFVRRQYIPLPEAHVRAEQLHTLLGHQKHGLNRKDIEVLVDLTDGFSGSDITALAKDAAMGPLRSLGEALLYMSTDEIRPINFSDFEASLVNIRPSVSKQGLQEFEDWAKEFGERGG